jgi:hypothetical protein
VKGDKMGGRFGTPEERTNEKVSIGKSEGKTPHRRIRRKWENNRHSRGIICCLPS